LQWQAELPQSLLWFGAAAAAATGAWCVVALAGPVPLARAIAAVFAVLAAAALGFTYAAGRAEVRLADALPTEWEGEDIAVVGVVDDLPQSSARGTRFALAVERTLTRGAVVPLAAGARLVCGGGKGGVADPVPPIAAGERWRSSSV
jgi:predicted membrane metal-binding protein